MKHRSFAPCLMGVLLTSTLSYVKASKVVETKLCYEEDWEIHPVLCRLVEYAETDVEAFARDAYDWAERNHMIVSLPSTPMDADVDGLTSIQRRGLNLRTAADATVTNSIDNLPVVFAHGMGDSCFNRGMQHIVQKVADMLNVYATCIPTGDTQAQDTKNGYFLNMDASVDVFATKVQEDPQLANGFHAIGFSQGNNIIRGYISKHNTPTVHTFLSVNGVNAGIGAVPYCRPVALGETMLTGTSTVATSTVSNSMCDLLMEQASRAAYTEFAQQHSFQANYWRDPRTSALELYQTYGQLAVWNNEAGFVNETLKENFGKTARFVWILATQDGMVWPKEGEQWGSPDPKDPFVHILPREQTEWYLKDLFGLRTAEEAGKNVYESFEGDHLQFTEEDFDRWINTYLRQN